MRPLSAASALRPGLDHQDDRQADEAANDDPNRAGKDGPGSEADQGGDEVSPITRHLPTSSGLRGTSLNAGPGDVTRSVSSRNETVGQARRHAFSLWA
jgi:hypothetical protein